MFLIGTFRLELSASGANLAPRYSLAAWMRA